MKSDYAPRVFQLEAAALDNTCKSILNELLLKVVTLNNLRPEVHLLVDFLYYRFTVAIGKPLPSHAIENIEFLTKLGTPLGSRQKLLYFLFNVVAPYLLKRAQLDQRTPRLAKVLGFAFGVVNLIYFAVFLSNRFGVPSDLLLWLAGIAVYQPKLGLTRELDFEILNRTLIWNTLADVLQFVLSSQSVKSLGNLFMLSSVWGSLAISDDKGCLICREVVCVMPVTIKPCGHIYCYYCFKNRDLKQCLKCQQGIESYDLQ